MKLFRNTAAILSLALAMSGSAKSQLTGSVEGMISMEKDHSFVRGNLFYKLPLGIKGYTFLEAYPDNSAQEVGKGFFGKTTLSREIVPETGLTGMIQLAHLTGVDDRLAAGMKYSLPMPGGISFAVQFFPAYLTTDMKKVENRSMLGYVASAILPFDLNFSSFAEININGQKGIEWGYGEAGITYRLPFAKELSMGWVAGLRNIGVGRALPRFENRATIAYTP